jgi:hypothetical protein
MDDLDSKRISTNARPAFISIKNSLEVVPGKK